MLAWPRLDSNYIGHTVAYEQTESVAEVVAGIRSIIQNGGSSYVDRYVCKDLLDNLTAFDARAEILVAGA